MASKKRKGRVKSKAALATAAAQTGQRSSEFQPPRSRGGLMTKMRTGFVRSAGASDDAEPPSFLQKALWFVVISAAVFFFARGL
jgi:hypothetical protein